MIVQSDRGSQYASALHQVLLARHGLVGSMSRKGNCWDSAVMERFFFSLKTERVWQRDHANHAEAMSDIANYIVASYNSVRLHSKLGNLPPNAFEQLLAINEPTRCPEKFDQHVLAVEAIYRALDGGTLSLDLPESIPEPPAVFTHFPMDE